PRRSIRTPKHGPDWAASLFSLRSFPFQTFSFPPKVTEDHSITFWIENRRPFSPLHVGRPRQLKVPSGPRGRRGTGLSLGQTGGGGGAHFHPANTFSRVSRRKNLTSRGFSAGAEGAA